MVILQPDVARRRPAAIGRELTDQCPVERDANVRVVRLDLERVPFPDRPRGALLRRGESVNRAGLIERVARLASIRVVAALVDLDLIALIHRELLGGGGSACQAAPGVLRLPFLL